TYEKIIDTEVSTLVARVKAATDCPMIKVIRIPHLYVPEGEDLVESFGSQGDRASSILPNTINGQPLDSVFLTLDPLQDQFRTKLVDAIRPLGISVEFVNKVSLYVGKAGVHCGTSAVRTCSPR
ncbi:MAG TPA: protein-arginine deiminase family protein, partial [Oligoflexus sp.]|uniref:protein-arginine deiminase family protein n=1 Tax=Oligoflexus sp. TaxID=1971216 RepID=UPI002D6EBB99